jgi:hypothetical protein
MVDLVSKDPITYVVVACIVWMPLRFIGILPDGNVSLVFQIVICALSGPALLGLILMPFIFTVGQIFEPLLLFGTAVFGPIAFVLMRSSNKFLSLRKWNKVGIELLWICSGLFGGAVILMFASSPRL